MDREYNPALTAWRGIAALCILFHHLFLKFLPQLGDSVSQYTRIVEKSYLWVDFFFILSGYLLATLYRTAFLERTISYQEFVIRRFARIYPVHFLVLMAFLFFQLLYWFIGDADAFTQTFSLSDFFRNLFMIQAVQTHPTHVSWNGPAWSISAEWWVYLSFPVLLWLIRFIRTQIMACIAVVLLTLLLTAISRLHSFELDLTGYLGLLRCVIEFTMGVLLSYLVRQTRFQFLFQQRTTACLAVLLVLSLHLDISSVVSVFLMFLIIGSVSKTTQDQQSLASNVVLQRLGDYSYGIYMLHWLVIFIVSRIYSLAFGTWPSDISSFAAQLVLMCAVTVLTLVSAMICFHSIEKTSRKKIVEIFMKN